MRRHKTKLACMVRRRSTVRFRNGAQSRCLNSKIWTPGCESRWGLTGARRRHQQAASASPARLCRSPGDARAAPSDPGHGGEGAGDACAGIMPTPGGPGTESRAIIWCRAVYRIPPGPGRGHQLRHGARTTGGWGTAPGDDDLDAATAHPGQGGGRQPALPAGQQPARGAPGTGGHAARRTDERQGLLPARRHHGHKPPTWLDRSGAGAQDCLR